MIAILHTIVSHYRVAFFDGLAKKVPVDVYTYLDRTKKEGDNFNVSDFKVKHLKSTEFKKFLFYSLTPFISRKYDTIVLMWNFGHISTWILLFTKFFHGKKIILWGHGISVKRYLSEEQKPAFVMKIMAYLADGLWLYMDKEARQWKKLFPNKDIVALNNTLSDVEEILKVNYSSEYKSELKESYKISQEIIFIYCARFNNSHRRIDLLLEAIQRFDKERYGFIIIGDGPIKPDFKGYSNVYDYGSVYDKGLKDILFSISDIYFQPGWVGLSIVEAMAYRKPIFTLKRSRSVLQCVEYSYIKDGENGFTFESIDEMIEVVASLSSSDLFELGKSGQEYVSKNLMIDDMISNALKII